jgi:lysophospholipase L1-like esterase
MVGRAAGRALTVLLAVLVAAIAITVSLLVTPMQSVTAVGQQFQVGTASPSWHLSGPGELDLFGQRLATSTVFAGPLRPRIALTRISLSEQLTQFAPAAGGSAPQDVARALVRGWEHYVAWQSVLVALVALVLAGAVAGWRRTSRRAAIGFIAAAVVAALVTNISLVALTSITTPERLRTVTSLQALVGGAPLAPIAPPTALPSRTVRAVVIGDSTAAGLGNPLVDSATAADRACGRSRDSFAADLAANTGLSVVNLACSGATIAQGLLGSQTSHRVKIPAQLAAPAAATASTVLTSIGANDVHWADILAACAAVTGCASDAQQVYFQQQLALFSRSYLDLLTQLAALPNHPHVIINLYYNPFTGDDSCIAGLTPVVQATLTAELGALNAVLARGAQTASFAVAAPDFTGHGLCAADPYVQGPGAPAPMHPTAAGQLAIAIADAQAMADQGS